MSALEDSSLKLSSGANNPGGIFVLLLCGLPGSGKSTISERLCATKENFSFLLKFNRVVHIEYDKVAQNIYSDNPTVRNKTTTTATTTTSTDSNLSFNEQSLEAWRISRLAALEQLEDELQKDCQNATKGKEKYDMDSSSSSVLIVMDDNFHLRSMRRDVYRTCQQYCERILINYAIVWVDTPFHLCWDRNQKRPFDSGRRIPDHVMHNLYEKMELPKMEAKSPACGEQSYLRLVSSSSNDGEDTTTMMLEQINQFLLRASNSGAAKVMPPPPPVDPEILEQERRATLESRIHYFDRLLRTWVGQVAKINRKKVGHANLARKEILPKLRSPQEEYTRMTIEDSSEQVFQLFIAILIRESEWENDGIMQLTTVLRESSAKIPHTDTKK